jgi:hypothetical protein
MVVEETGARNDSAGKSISNVTDRPTEYVESVEVWFREKWEAGSWGPGQFEKGVEGELLPLEAATKQQLVKTVKALCVLQLQWSLECVTQWDWRNCL